MKKQLNLKCRDTLHVHHVVNVLLHHKKDIVVEVDNSIVAKLGDRVSVNMESINILKTVDVAYIFPLISLLIGTIATYYVL